MYAENVKYFYTPLPPLLAVLRRRLLKLRSAEAGDAAMD